MIHEVLTDTLINRNRSVCVKISPKIRGVGEVLGLCDTIISMRNYNICDSKLICLLLKHLDIGIVELKKVARFCFKTDMLNIFDQVNRNIVCKIFKSIALQQEHTKSGMVQTRVTTLFYKNHAYSQGLVRKVSSKSSEIRYPFKFSTIRRNI